MRKSLVFLRTSLVFLKVIGFPRKDLHKILENLEKGILTSLKGEGLSDKDLLRATIERLKIKLEELAGQIQNIKQNETFELLSEIDDWDLYFEQTREKLQEELDELRKKL